MKFFRAVLLLSVTTLLATSCASWKQQRWLDDHHRKLQRLADSNLSAEAKLDALLQDYVDFMKQDLKFVDPVKGVKYVQKYHQMNQPAMTKILRDSEAWQTKLSLADKVSFGVRAVKKPYFRDLIELAPKFKRKYKQYAFAVKMTSEVTGGLAKVLGKELGE